MPGMARPDAVIVVLNSTNLHSHLVLAGRVIALGLPTLVLLNMADELHKQDGGVDVLSLARAIGNSGGAGQRDHRRRVWKRLRIFFRPLRPRPSRWSFPWSAVRAACASGPFASERMRTIAVPPRRFGPDGSTTCFCIASGDR